MTRGRFIAACCAALLIATLPCPRAAADAMPKISPGWYVPVGLTLAASVHEDRPDGFVLGAEVSAAHIDLDTGLWYGAYADALWDFGPDAFRWSLGPEIGVAFLGFDAGYMAEVHDGVVAHGLTFRTVLTLSVVALYGRWGRLFRHATGDDYLEVGLLLKFPVAARTGPPGGRR